MILHSDFEISKQKLRISLENKLLQKNRPLKLTIESYFVGIHIWVLNRLQAFLDFRGFDFCNFWFNAAYNSILFSSPLVLKSNLDLRGFYFRGFLGGLHINSNRGMPLHPSIRDWVLRKRGLDGDNSFLKFLLNFSIFFNFILCNVLVWTLRYFFILQSLTTSKMRKLILNFKHELSPSKPLLRSTQSLILGFQYIVSTVIILDQILLSNSGAPKKFEC